jgi:hypothetical protein
VVALAVGDRVAGVRPQLASVVMVVWPHTAPAMVVPAAVAASQPATRQRALSMFTASSRPR